MNDIDLPEIAHPHYSRAELRARNDRLLRTFCIVASAYALVHKLVVPVMLGFTPLKGTPFARVDWWLFHPLAFAYFAHRKGPATLLSFLAGMGVAYGIYELIELFLGRHPGWLSFSRILSSLPVAALSILMLADRRLALARVAAIAGILSVIALAVEREWHLKEESPRHSSIPTPAPLSEPTFNAEPPQGEWVCGRSELRLSPAMTIPPRGTTLHVRDCGLSPSRLLASEAPLEISNETSAALNIHFDEVDTRGKRRTGWNLVVPAGAKLRAPGLSVHSDNIGIIYSDTRPAAGLSAVLPTPLNRAWRLVRKPLGAFPEAQP